MNSLSTTETHSLGELYLTLTIYMPVFIFAIAVLALISVLILIYIANSQNGISNKLSTIADTIQRGPLSKQEFTDLQDETLHSAEKP